MAQRRARERAIELKRCADALALLNILAIEIEVEAAGQHVLLDAQFGHEERMDDVARTEGEQDRFADGHDELERRREIVDGAEPTVFSGVLESPRPLLKPAKD